MTDLELIKPILIGFTGQEILLPPNSENGDVDIELHFENGHLNVITVHSNVFKVHSDNPQS